jgi:hypothetical protein
MMIATAAFFADLAMQADASPAMEGSISNNSSNDDTHTLLKRDGVITVEHIDSGMLMKRAPGPCES